MQKRGRILLYATAGVAAVIAGAVLVAILLFPAERIREFVETAATDAVGLPVRIERVGLTFRGLPAVTVSGIRIGAPRTDEPPLAEIDAVHARVALLKLLTGKVKEIPIALLIIDAFPILSLVLAEI